MRSLMQRRIGVVTTAVLAVVLTISVLALAGNDAQHIAQANAKIEQIVDQATDKIEKAHSYDKMVQEAQKAETRVFRVLDQLEKKIGDVDFTPFYVTVCNDDVDECVTFDPVRIIGSGRGG